jgi:hypothetical protein
MAASLFMAVISRQDPAVLIAIFLILFLAASLARRLRTPPRRDEASTPTLPHRFQFPPSRRHVLAKPPELEGLPSWREAEVTPELLCCRALPSTTNTDLGESNFYTPTGFSTRHIKALGLFPDYALLSGVPHPEPCSPTWDISKAVFRPFRPFRWNYHQHMGKISLATLVAPTHL